MGHKIHPIGFRLGITAEDKSIWHINMRNYINYVQEDYALRKTLIDFLDKIGFKFKGIVTIYIYRIKTHNVSTIIKVKTARPGIIIGKNALILKDLDRKLSAKTVNKKIQIQIDHIKTPTKYADLLAEIVVEELEQRVPFRRTMKKVMDLVIHDNEIKGIKVQISGRLNGADIARTEWLRNGRIPLQTIRANIDFSHKTAQITYGTLGIKIWLFKGEIFNSTIPKN